MTDSKAYGHSRLQTIRVLIVEDSPTSRALLVALFSGTSEFEVVGEAANGAEAIEKTIELSPDLIIMDVYMPVVDGVDATKEIMREAPTPIVMVSASASTSDVSLGLSATQAGALVLLEKPHDPRAASYGAECAHLLATAKAMAHVKVVRRWGTEHVGRSQDRWAATPPRPVPAPTAAVQRPRLIAIGTSTGGPAALHRILIDLPRDISVPIVIVQHMAVGFIDGLAKWLGANVGLKVVVAGEGDPLVPGTVYLAGHDRHLGVTATGRATLSDTSPLAGFRPSADFLFDSCARAYGSALIAVVLTGMGYDGLAGLQTVHQRGGRVLAQDQHTSVVFGMAKEAIDSGVVNEILPLESIGRRLAELVRVEQP